jgi:hypothetical protein
MDYPLNLIPNPTLEIISPPNRDHYLGVWVSADKPFKDSDGKLDAAAIDIARIPGFSTNKIPESKVSDLNICFIGDRARYFNYTSWNLGENGVMPTNEDFKTDEDRNNYFIQIYNISEFTDEYHNPPHDESKVYTFTVYVVHKPLIANYWHFELSVVSDANHNLAVNSGKWRGLVFSLIRDRVQDKAVFEI